jgi:translocation and assembly module TamB
MMFRKFSFKLAKYMVIMLCIFTVLLTTPWGTQLTVVLLNNINGLTLEYKSGSLVRDVEFSTVDLKLENLNIVIKSLSTELNFSCVWKKKLCIKSIKADDFLLAYTSKEKSENIEDDQTPNTNQLFEMPFNIKADYVKLKKSHLSINQTEISIEQLTTQLTIDQSKFNLIKPSAKQLTVMLEKHHQDKPIAGENKGSVVNFSVAQLPDISLPISLIIDQLSIANIVVATENSEDKSCLTSCSQNITEQWQSSKNKLSGSWALNTVNIRQFSTATSAFEITKLVADANLKPPYQLDTQIVSQIKDIPQWPEVAEANQNISIKGSLEDLTFNINSQGSLALTSQGHVNLVHKEMPFKITVDAQKLPMPLSYADYANPSSLMLVVSGNTQAQSVQLLSELQSYGYNNAKIKLTAKHHQGHFFIEALNFNNQANKNEHSLASQLHLQGDVTLALNDVSWNLSAHSSGFTLPKINLAALAKLSELEQSQIDNLTLNIPDSLSGRLQGKITSTGELSSKQWAVSISDTDIKGKINHADLIIKGDFGVNKTGQLQPGQLLLSFNDSELKLKTASEKYWDINGQLSIGNIALWFPGMHGSLTSKFSVDGEQDNPVINMYSQITQLNWQQWLSTSLVVEGTYQPNNNHKIQLQVNNSQLIWAKENRIVNIDDFSFNVSGDATNHQISSAWGGDFIGKLALKGQLNNTFTHWHSSVATSSLAYRTTALTNDKTYAVAVDFSKQQAIISNHCWQGKGINICLPSNTIVGESGDVAINLDIDLTAIDQLILPKDIELISQLHGDIKAQWSSQKSMNTEAIFSLSSGYVKVTDDFNEHQLSQWSHGDIAFSLNEQSISSKILLTDVHNKPLLNINSKVELTNDFPINAKVVINQFNLQPFQDVLAHVVNLQGNLTADIAIEGTLEKPLINGDISLNQGELLLSQNANTITDISTTLVIENNDAAIQGKFALKDKEANLLGTLSWQDSLALNVDLQADALPLVFPPQLTMNISPNLNFLLKDKILAITGNIDVLDGSYNIEKLPEGSVSLSDDVIIIDQAGQTLVKESSGFDIKTDIRVNIDKAFSITGQGLDTHLFGQLQITQQQKQPLQLFGKVQSDEGTFQAYGQKLKIDTGEITFNGPIYDPYFNLLATRNIKSENIDVGIQVTGLVNALKMKLFSSPVMENSEMLSYLVRGRGLDAGAENSTAAASFLVGFGITNNIGLFEQIEKLPLISDIAVDTEGEGDQTQATVSGYLGNRVYLKYGIGVYEPINELTIRMYIFNRLWLEIVSGLEQSTDIYYSFDID